MSVPVRLSSAETLVILYIIYLSPWFSCHRLSSAVPLPLVFAVAFVKLAIQFDRRLSGPPFFCHTTFGVVHYHRDFMGITPARVTLELALRVSLLICYMVKNETNSQGRYLYAGDGVTPASCIWPQQQNATSDMSQRRNGHGDKMERWTKASTGPDRNWLSWGLEPQWRLCQWFSDCWGHLWGVGM